MRGDDWTTWALRAVWALLPFTLGPALAETLDGWSTSPRTTAAALLWLGWAAVAIATCVALPALLVVVRVGTAAGAAVGLATLHPSLVVPVVAAGLAARPEIAEWFVNGPAYANERRYPLRVPGALLLGPLWLAGAVIAGGPAAGVLLIADGNPVVGGVVLVLGLGGAVVAARALFSLTRRWLVFVPAGVVLHDPVALVDPVLIEKKLIESLRAADAESDSLDLTQNALGLAVELVLTEKVPMVLNRGRGQAESGSSGRLLFTPTRPGRVLAEAAQRRLFVG